MDNFHSTKWTFALLTLNSMVPVVMLQAIPSCYDVVELERFGRSGGVASAINDTGQAVGTVSGDLPVASVFWDINDDPSDGESHLLSKPGYLFPRLDDINNNGIAVGTFVEEATSSTSYAMKYDVKSRLLTKLGTLEEEGDNGTWASAINDMNIAVGIGGSPEAHDGIVFTMWSGTTPSVIHSDRVFGSWQANINANNVIATTLIQEDYTQVRGSPGSLVPLSLPPNHQTYGRVTAINDNDLTVGWVRRATVHSVHYDSAVWWDETGVPHILPPLGNVVGAPFGINNAGDIVGVAGSMGVLWQHDGFDYRSYLLNEYVRTPGWSIRFARDINEDGWILAEGLYGSDHYKPVILIPRIDELDPEGEWQPRSPMSATAEHELLIYWTDDGIIDESTLDDQDIRIQKPDGSSVLAKLKSIGKSVWVVDKYRWPVVYTMDAPGGEWDEADDGEYIVFVEADEVADQSGRAVEAAELGRFTFNSVQAPVWIRRGTVRPLGQNPRYCFDFGLDGTAHKNQSYPEIDYIALETPASDSFTLVEDPVVVYTYALEGDTEDTLLPFGDGDYQLFIKFAIGSHAWDLWYGDVAAKIPLAEPVQYPTMTSIDQSVTQDSVMANIEWEPVTDASVNAISITVHEVLSGDEVFSVQIDDPSITSWGPIQLVKDKTYRIRLSFENTIPDQPVEIWRLTTTKYLATEVEFSAGIPEVPVEAQATLRMGPGASLFIEGRAGSRARVEYNESLDPDGWEELMTTILGGQAEKLLEMGDAQAATRFFRVVIDKE